MAAKLSPFHSPLPFRSHLIKNTPDLVPSIDELEALQSELKSYKQKCVERARKAEDGIRTIEDSMRRMSEREKGKFKSVDRIKRERDFTPLPDADDSRQSSVLHNHSHKPRPGSQFSGANSASGARSSVDPRRLTAEELKRRKKKRPREGGDSDNERESQRPRKSTPPVLHSNTHLPPPKVQKPPNATSLSHKASTSVSGPDFSAPPPNSLHTSSLLPARPPEAKPPSPGPSKPIEVMTDFSNIKVPQQTAINSFYTSLEPWIRPIKEEDIGFLDFTADEVEPFIMPKLGRHYLEVWEDQDSGVLPVLGEPQVAPASHFAAPTPKWDPSTLSDGDLVVEEKGHGPLTERLISALLPNPDSAAWKGVKAAEDAMEGRPGGSGAAAARRERLNVNDLEARIQNMMRVNGLLPPGTVPDFTEKVDDPIASALREAQSELRRVVALNKARKARLIPIAKNRLSYQEYLEVRDSLDKNITNLYAKMQKKDAPKVNKKKKKPLQGAAAASAAAAAANNGGGSGGGYGNGGNGGGMNGLNDEIPLHALPPCPAALGLTPDEDNRLTVHDQLTEMVRLRRQWVDEVGSVFDEMEMRTPGSAFGLPRESIYAGMEDEVQALLMQSDPGGDHVDFAANGFRFGEGGGGSRGVSVGGSVRRGESDAMDVG